MFLRLEVQAEIASTVTLMAACQPGRQGRCWWCSDLAIAEAMVARDEREGAPWAMSWWRVVGASHTRGLGRQQAPRGIQRMPMRDTEECIVGHAVDVDVEVAADVEEEDAGAEQHKEESDSTGHESAQDSGRGDSGQSEDETHPENTAAHDVHIPPEPTPEQLAEIRRRRGKGYREELHDSEGFLHETLLTWRAPTRKTPHGAYQATCYEHDADLCQRAGKPYYLYCRKELPCQHEDDHANVVQTLRAWITNARTFHSRVEHRDCDMEAFRAQSRRHRSSSSSSSSREVGDKGSAGSKAGGKGGDSTHGGVTGGGGAPSPAASVAAATSADMPATAAAAALEKKRCETCGDAHVDEDCWLLAMTLQQSIDDARVAKNIAQVIPIGVSAEHGCICEGSEVATKDVPGDGNCLFHAS